MPPTLTLPRADGTLARYTVSGQSPVAPPRPRRYRLLRAIR